MSDLGLLSVRSSCSTDSGGLGELCGLLCAVFVVVFRLELLVVADDEVDDELDELMGVEDVDGWSRPMLEQIWAREASGDSSIVHLSSRRQACWWRAYLRVLLASFPGFGCLQSSN